MKEASLASQRGCRTGVPLHRLRLPVRRILRCEAQGCLFQLEERPDGVQNPGRRFEASIFSRKKMEWCPWPAAHPRQPYSTARTAVPDTPRPTSASRRWSCPRRWTRDCSFSDGWRCRAGSSSAPPGRSRRETFASDTTSSSPGCVGTGARSTPEDAGGVCRSVPRLPQGRHRRHT
ncbi:unnamed protein product [Ectocarpus sp. 12 AP-2014]